MDKQINKNILEPYIPDSMDWEYPQFGFNYKGSSTKSGASEKQIAKRRKKNRNKKTHR